MGEHGGRYLHLPHFLKDAVDAVYCLDLRGHGRSEGLRGHAERFDSMADDVALTVRRMHELLMKRFGKAEVHLLGHSLGGHIVLRTLFLYPELPIVSSVVSAPFLAVKARVPIVKRLAARALSKVWGSLQLDTGMVLEHICRDQGVVETYRHDRLTHPKMTPQFYTGMVEAWKDTLSREGGIRHPLQMLVPMGDEIVDSEVTLEWFRRVKLRDKQLKQYPGFYHEPLNEIGKEEVFADISGWLRSHAGESPR
jgi:alpha-beta hydrolase superfamily lysophospholipase